MNVGDHRHPHRRALRLALATGSLAAGGVAAWLLWRTSVPELAPVVVEAADVFSADVLERGNDYRRGTRAFWAGSIAVQLCVLAALAWVARPVASHLERLARGRLRTATLMAVLVAVVVWATSLPLGAGRLAWRRRFDLTDQSYAGWLLDTAIGLLVTTVLVVLAVVIVVSLATRLGRAWWPVGGGLLALCGLAFIVLQPLVIEPLSNDFRPLDDPVIEADVRELAAIVGVDVARIEVRDQSRRTRAANAKVTGIGPSRRVVVDDTLLSAGPFARAEVRSVVAHELAHVERSHRWKGAAWFALIVIPSAALLALILERIRPGAAADPAIVPIGLLVALVIFLATSPLQNAVSRRYEAEADWIALRATDDPEALERVMEGFVITNAGDPTRPGWVTHMLGTHPSTLERISMARAYAGLAPD